MKIKTFGAVKIYDIQFNCIPPQKKMKLNENIKRKENQIKIINIISNVLILFYSAFYETPMSTNFVFVR